MLGVVITQQKSMNQSAKSSMLLYMTFIYEISLRAEYFLCDLSC